MDWLSGYLPSVICAEDGSSSPNPHDVFKFSYQVNSFKLISPVKNQV